ncbi:MAG: hypothetical protein MSG64_06485 [Pyrinomonadaceae bacterium MAG19_C2-C3]|nr:hypothetical protein [Pyrinomonadaceae bacterium MAG19_C2-C3]
MQNRYLNSDYARRKLSETPAEKRRVAPTIHHEKLRGEIVVVIAGGTITHDGIADACGYSSEDTGFINAISHLRESKIIDYRHTGREVYSYGARCTVEERNYFLIKEVKL